MTTTVKTVVQCANRTSVERSLAYAVKHVLPDAQFSKHALYRAFLRGLERHCNAEVQVVPE